MTAATIIVFAAMAAGFAPAHRVVEGNPASTVRVIAYESLACGDCAAYRRMLDEKLLPEYGTRVAFEHRDFPLAKQPWSRAAAVAARCLEENAPEKAVQFRRDILSARRDIAPDTLEAWLRAWAGRNGFDAANLVASLRDERCQALVESDSQDGIARGVSKTPTVFVDGTPFIETFTVEEISRAIDRALAAQ